MITDSYVPPKAGEIYVWQKEGRNSYLVVNSRGPNWFVTNKFGVFLIELCNGRLSLGKMKLLLQQAGLSAGVDSLDRFFIFLEKIRFFDEGSAGGLDLLGSVFLNITAKCNLRCVYCYYDSNSARPARPEAALRVWTSIIHQIYAINREAVITVSGGEPFLSKNLFPVLDTLHKLSMRTRIYTNGTRIDDGDIQRLKKYDNLDYIQISLDSVVDEENIKTRTVHPGKIMKTLHRLRSEGLPVVVSCTVTGVNINSVEKLADYCRDQDLKYRFVNYFPTPGRAVENISAYKVNEVILAQKIGHLDGEDNHNINITKGYKRLTKRTACGLGRILSISEAAKVYPCNHLYMDEFVMGDATADPLADIIERSSHNVFKAVPVDTMHPCRYCELRYICGGSCRATAYHQKGRLDVGTSECSFLKEVIVNTLWEQCLAGRNNFSADAWCVLD